MKKPLHETLPKIQIPPGLAPGEYSVRPDGTVVPKAFETPKPLERLRSSATGSRKRDPLKNHSRAAETRELMKKAHVDDEVEVMDLQGSELACDVADLWVKARHSSDLSVSYEGRLLGQALVRLELVTRPSAMRKVRP